MAKKRKIDVIINKDRISELPNNLIESIIERISIKEAARTSILSTKWRYIWTKIPTLVLDKQFLEVLSPNKRIKSFRFVKVVDNILMLHNGLIHKFLIHIPFCQTPDMDLWILYLSRNGVKELSLYNSYPQSYKLPSYIFSCDQLTHLKLHNCVINTPLEFRGFCNLTQLYLKKISLSTNTGLLISTLPSLVSLGLWLCTGVKNINNLPPKLSLFALVGNHEAEWQWFQSKTQLSVLGICLCNEVKNVDVQGKIFKLNSFLSNLPNLVILRLDGFALKFLGAGDFTEFHQLNRKLKEITLFSIQFNDLDQFYRAICLLKSSPNLEKLEIEASSLLNDGLEQHDFSYIVGIADSNLKLNCFRSATLRFFAGLKAELGLVELLLSHSPVLKKMEIESNGGMDADKELEISMQLMRFRRACAKSEIIYTGGQINKRPKFPL